MTTQATALIIKSNTGRPGGPHAYVHARVMWFECRNVRDLLTEMHVNLPPYYVCVHAGNNDTQACHVCNPHPAGLAKFLVHPLNYIESVGHQEAEWPPKLNRKNS